MKPDLPTTAFKKGFAFIGKWLKIPADPNPIVYRTAVH
jgi:hypothetical protein